MTPEKINIHQSRDFSDIINVTFYFIQRNFRKLFLSVVLIAGPFALLTGINTAYFQPVTVKASRGFWSGEYFVGLGVGYFVYMLIHAVLAALIYHFIQLEAEKKEFGVSDVWARVRKDVPNLLLINLGALLIIVFAMFCLVIPGIYTAITLSFISVVWLVERNGFTSAVSRSYKLVYGRWWRTFGILCILLFVQFLISTLLVVPIQIIGSLSGLFDLSMNLMGTDDSAGAIAWLAIRNMFSMLCSSILMVALVFHYYSLVEEKDGMGLMAKIRTMGTQPSVNNQLDAEEEY
jgi:hypothetical protein